MSDTEKVYHYEKLLNHTVNSYKEMKKDAERVLTSSLTDYPLKLVIKEYNDIIIILSAILENLEDK